VANLWQIKLAAVTSVWSKENTTDEEVACTRPSAFSPWCTSVCSQAGIGSL